MKKIVLLFIGGLTLSLAGCGDEPAPHVHDYQKVDGVAATCIEEGTKEHYHCEGCEKDFFLVDEEYVEVESADELVIPLAEHHYDLVEAVAATDCLHVGVKEHYHCDVCSKDFILDNEEYVEVSEHDLETGIGAHSLSFKKSTATCQHDGVKEHYHCSKCEKNFLKVDGEYVEASDEDLYEAQKDHDIDTKYGCCRYKDCTEAFDSNLYDLTLGGKQVYDVADHGYRFYIDYGGSNHSVLSHSFVMTVWYYSSASDPTGSTYDTNKLRVYYRMYRDSTTEHFAEQKTGFEISKGYNFFVTDFKYSGGKTEDSFVKFAVEIKCLYEAHHYDLDGVCIDCGHHAVAPVVSVTGFGSYNYTYNGTMNQIISFIIDYHSKER